MDEATQIIALDTLRDKVLASHAQISDAKYGSKDTKLSIKFRTPTQENENKELTLAVFMSGKVNILGGLCPRKSGEICAYLEGLLEQWHHRIIVRQGGLHIVEPNIEQDDDMVAIVLDEIDPLRVRLGPMTDEEVKALCALVGF